MHTMCVIKKKITLVHFSKINQHLHSKIFTFFFCNLTACIFCLIPFFVNFDKTIYCVHYYVTFCTHSIEVKSADGIFYGNHMATCLVFGKAKAFGYISKIGHRINVFAISSKRPHISTAVGQSVKSQSGHRS